MDIKEFIASYNNYPVLFLGSGFSLRYLKNSFGWDDLLEKISFEMKPDAAVDVEKIPEVLEEYKHELSFQAGKNPTFVLDLSKTKKVKQLEKIEHCVNSLNSLIIR